MNCRWISLIAAGSLAASMPPRLALAAPAQSNSDVELAVDTSDLGEYGDSLRERIVVEGEKHVRDAGLVPAAQATDEIIVVVTATNDRGTGFAFDVRARAGGNELTSAAVVGSCDRCRKEDVVARVRDAVEAQLDALRVHHAQANADEPPPPRPPSSANREVEPVPLDGPGRRPIGKLGTAGIVVGTIGVLAAATGIGLAVRGAKRGAEENDAERGRSVETRNPGIALAATGGAALVTGIVLLVVDRARAKRSRTVVIVPARAGLFVVGHF